MLNFINKDESTQIVALRTKYVIVGSDICRSITKDQALKKLNDIIQLNQLPKVFKHLRSILSFFF